MSERARPPKRERESPGSESSRSRIRPVNIFSYFLYVIKKYKFYKLLIARR